MGHDTSVSLAVPNELLTTRVLRAPRELVWRVLTTAGQVEPWWGPTGFSTVTETMEVRVGGRWLHTMIGPDGKRWPNRIVYTQVEPPALLAWDHDDGASAEPMFRCRVTLEALGAERTLLTLRHVFASAAARDANLAVSGAVQGAIDTTERLAAWLLVQPDPRDFVIQRTFDAPRERVFAAWTEPLQLARWFGPRGMSVPVCEIDLRVGGRWRLTMRGPWPGPQETDFPLEGEYLEIVAPERIVSTVDCSGHPPFWHDQVRPGRAADDRNPAGTMLQIVSLEALAPSRTRLTVRQRAASEAVLAALRRMGMEDGWSQSLDRLAEQLREPG